jgi:DNA-binding response OmpR family regulator
MKILLVEDDIDLNKTIKEYLQNYYEIESVFDGEEALKKAYENNYDVMIFDLKLPKMDDLAW